MSFNIEKEIEDGIWLFFDEYHEMPKELLISQEWFDNFYDNLINLYKGYEMKDIPRKNDQFFFMNIPIKIDKEINTFYCVLAPF